MFLGLSGLKMGSIEAFVTMITLCMIAIVGGHSLQPRAANVAEVPALFGVCVYSFMCHHSLPSLLAPVKPKKGLCWMLAGDIFIIFVFYNFLALTGIFTFEHIKDVYTLNFEPTTGHSMVPVVPYFQYFLLIYPVLTLSSNFPIIAITLTNNLRNLMLREDSAWHMQQVVVPLLALLPPCIIALVVEDVEFLVNFTGSYAGAMIQYVIPTTLVCIARRKVDAQFGPGVINKFASPFRWKYWVHFVMVWTAFCIICVTAHITNKFVKA
ncbi:transmembrane protein-like [Tropilaelaps mercedesae]|uniref:Transmembrane protein-like n=1 Tax=Tropilaelaps mercedesae TaxID=418985 RepID=A0A1V9XV86_9ACAR|nr:transmembrane protein-like [Tropilaelaps mercedesae]